MKKIWIPTTGLILAPIFFIGSCVVAASDPQGAIVFLFSLPVIAALLGAAFFFTAKVKDKTQKKILLSVGGAQVGFIVLFLSGLAFSVTNKITTGTINVVSKGFEAATGMTPYSWGQGQSRYSHKITEALRTADSLTVGMLDIGRPWTRVCMFGPYTSEKDAANVIGFFSHTMGRSRVPTTDQFVAMVFLDDKGVLNVVDIPRRPVDLRRFTPRCYDKNQFPLWLTDKPKIKRPSKSLRHRMKKRRDK